MLPSMPFLSTNSETSIPLPECANESHTKSITSEKELPENGKDNGVSKKVSSSNVFFGGVFPDNDIHYTYVKFSGTR